MNTISAMWTAWDLVKIFTNIRIATVGYGSLGGYSCVCVANQLLSSFILYTLKAVEIKKCVSWINLASLNVDVPVHLLINVIIQPIHQIKLCS